MPRSQVTAAVNRVIQRAETRVRRAANGYRKGTLTLDEFATTLRHEAKTTHVAAYAAGKGGFKQMGPSDYGRIGATLKKQYAYLDRFMADLSAGEVALDGRFLQRAMLYVRDARRSYYQSDAAAHLVAGYTQERNILADAEHCEGCLAATAQGWVPIGTLPPVGTRNCLGNDLCTIEYR